MARTTPRPATIFLLTTSLFSNGAMRRMTSRGSAANLNEQIPLAPRVAKWRNVSQRISEEDFSLPKAAEDFPLRACGSGAGSPTKRRQQPGQAQKAYLQREPADHGDRAQCKPVSQAIQHAKRYTILATHFTSEEDLIGPGSTVGILGGGQLGRMFGIAARRMGYRVHAFEPNPDSPAGQISDVEINASH